MAVFSFETKFVLNLFDLLTWHDSIGSFVSQPGPIITSHGGSDAEVSNHSNLRCRGSDVLFSILITEPKMSRNSSHRVASAASPPFIFAAASKPPPPNPNTSLNHVHHVIRGRPKVLCICRQSFKIINLFVHNYCTIESIKKLVFPTFWAFN